MNTSKKHQLPLPPWQLALCATFLLSASESPASTTNYSIGLNFGADEYYASGNPTRVGTLAPTDVAGAPAVEQGNWNNFELAFNSADQMVADSNGTAVVTSAMATWSANNTWAADGRGADNIGFGSNSPNYKLYVGYLDSGSATTTTIDIDSLPDELTSGGYDVYIYTLGGAANRGGGYRILDYITLDVLRDYKYGEDVASPDSFIEDPGDDPDHSVRGDYIVFYGLHAGAIVIEATTENGLGFDAAGTTYRAPVNAIQLVADSQSLRFIRQPLNRRVLAGDTNVLLSAEAAGGAITYQWYKNSSPIPDATNLFLTLPAITTADDGAVFYSVASNQSGTLQSSNAVLSVGQLVAAPGLARDQVWSNYARVDIESGTLDNVAPSIQRSLPSLQAPVNDGSANFAERLSALFIPPATGDYVFFICSDDDSDLFISTDATPAGKYPIAAETAWSNARNWTGTDGGSMVSQKRSDQWVPDPANPPATPPYANGIHLEAGQAYYIEADHHQGTGGDNCEVTYKLVGEPDPRAGDASRLTGVALGAYAQTMNGATITITNQPQSTTGVQSQTATLTIGATTGYIGDDTGKGPALSYQWQAAPTGSSAFTNIPDAYGPTYTTPLLKLADNGNQYRVLLMAGDTNAASAVATLDLTPDTTAPRPGEISVVSADGRTVTLNFNELLDLASAQTPGGYSFTPGDIVATNAVLDASGLEVTLTAATPLGEGTNVLAISGVKDLAGNSVAAGTSIKFTFQRVTYEADILFDAPIAYYRFEETSGSVAKNDGSTGGDGQYSVGDEPSPMAGGAPGEAKGDPGPRPPEFAGFDADNRAASFDGVGDWVDTRNQFLNHRSAFTLEYWFKPQRTNDEGSTSSRVGIVGQNDAIEYGLRNPDEVRIYTSGGGALSATYTYPDNQWHHIATIASGTDLRTYFDGVLAASGGSATSDYGSSGYNVHVGGGGIFDATGNWFRGQIDEVAIFDKAIPAARVAEHYKAGKEGGAIVQTIEVTPAQESTIRLSIARTGGDVTVSWTPEGGTLQTTPAIGGAWSDVGIENPVTLPIGTGSAFFRVKQQ